MKTLDFSKVTYQQYLKSSPSPLVEPFFNHYLVPELRVYRIFDRPIGPHPIPSFEVNLFTPAEFGAFIPWLVINRGPLSCLIHPNTVDENGNSINPERDHTQRATWMGERIVLDTSLFNRMKRAKAEKEANGS